MSAKTTKPAIEPAKENSNLTHTNIPRTYGVGTNGTDHDTAPALPLYVGVNKGGSSKLPQVSSTKLLSKDSSGTAFAFTQKKQVSSDFPFVSDFWICEPDNGADPFITNKQLIKATNYSSGSLLRVYMHMRASMSAEELKAHAFMLDGLPTTFVSKQSSVRMIRHNQLCWTLRGVQFLFKESSLGGKKAVLQRLAIWPIFRKIQGSTAVSEAPACDVDVAEYARLAGTVIRPDTSAVSEAINTLVTSLFDQLKAAVSSAVSSHMLSMSLLPKVEPAATGVRKSERKDSSSSTASGVKPDKANGHSTLAQFLSSMDVAYTSKELTKDGFFGAEEIYNIPDFNFLDGNTGEKIHRSKFYGILRMEFHKKGTEGKPIPILKVKHVRDGLVTSFPVYCAKKDNPTDPITGEATDLDNPAYKAYEGPCIRVQTRYTAQAVAHIRNNWATLVKKYYALIADTKTSLASEAEA